MSAPLTKYSLVFDVFQGPEAAYKAAEVDPLLARTARLEDIVMQLAKNVANERPQSVGDYLFAKRLLTEPLDALLAAPKGTP